MPAKKNKKAKVTKKSPTKKTPVKTIKKVPAKKIVAKKAPNKPQKSKPKAAKKPAKKIVAKKPEKKIPAKKIEKKQLQKNPKTKAPKLAPVKDSKPAQKIEKKEEAKKSLAKTILAKTPREKTPEAPKQPERKSEALQKTIFVRKSEGRNKVSFKVGDYAVYPSHGVGKIVGIEKTSILGQDFSCYLMLFEREKLTIKIPMNSAEKIGLRTLISKSQMDEVFVILRSGVKKLKGMWSRRAQEYETKINSGDIILLAEVLRDLTRDIEDSERSYSERIIYETAINRLASEYSVIYGIDFEEAKEKVIVTAKDKLNSEGKVAQKDEFDEFDIEGDESEEEEDEDSEEEDEDEDEDGDEDDDDDYDDEDDDDAPRRKRKK